MSVLFLDSAPQQFSALLGSSHLFYTFLRRGIPTIQCPLGYSNGNTLKPILDKSHFLLCLCLSILFSNSRYLPNYTSSLTTVVGKQPLHLLVFTVMYAGQDDCNAFNRRNNDHSNIYSDCPPHTISFRSQVVSKLLTSLPEIFQITFL